MCCGESPASRPGCRCSTLGSWHLQTVHTSDHCDLWRCVSQRYKQAVARIFTYKPHARQLNAHTQRIGALNAYEHVWTCTVPLAVHMVHKILQHIMPWVRHSKELPHRRTDAPLLEMHVRRGSDLCLDTAPQRKISSALPRCTLESAIVASTLRIRTLVVFLRGLDTLGILSLSSKRWMSIVFSRAMTREAMSHGPIPSPSSSISSDYF